MSLGPYRAAQLAAFALIAVVATQVLYIVLRNNGVAFESSSIWIAEAIAFLAVSVAALVVMVRPGAAQTAAAAIALGGILNVLQVGMGLAMFGPLSDAGESMAPAYQAVLAGAFWFYFAGKALFGFAGILLGWFLLRSTGGAARIIGGLAVLTGIGALAVNGVALSLGMEIVFPAGATGTAATLFAALALPAVIQREEAAL